MPNKQFILLYLGNEKTFGFKYTSKDNLIIVTIVYNQIIHEQLLFSFVIYFFQQHTVYKSIGYDLIIKKTKTSFPLILPYK